MLKPKSQIFKLKFHLAKVEAINNKVNSKVHAYLHIDNEQLQFKGSPQLKKNVAIFGSDLEYDNFMIGFDQITGLYQQKKVLLVIQFETQGAYIKIGQVSINVGQILNQKKYRVVNVYPLSKCYDKSAKVKLAVDFIPISQKRENMVPNRKTDTNFKMSSLTVQKKEDFSSSNVGNQSAVGGNGFYKNPTGAIKSRLAEQQNVVLQERVYEYEKRMDNYRIAQNQLSQRMQEQLQRKDQKISQFSLQLTKQQNTIHLIALQNQSFKNDLRSQNQQLQIQKLQIKSHLSTIQNLQKQLQSKQKQLESKNISLQNLNRTKQNKQKHLSLEIQKYTNKYSQSQQERNKIIFQLENKLKLQLQKKDQHYQELININQGKYLQNIKAIKQRNKYLELHAKEVDELNQQQDNKIKSLTLELQKSQKLNQQQQEQMVYLNQQFNKIKKQKQSLNNQLDSINFSYQQTLAQLQSQKQLGKQLVKKVEILKTQLTLANQTVEQQRERIIVMSKDIQVHQERQYYMKEHYEEQIYDREVSECNVRGEKDQLLGQVKRYKQQMKLSEEKYQEEHTKTQLLNSTKQSLQKELNSKNSALMKVGQQKIYLQTELKKSKQLVQQLQQQLNKLQQQKAILSQTLMEKKLALENDKSLEWTYKIQSLQNDIQLMVQKFKNQKQQIKQQNRRQQVRRLQQINKLTQSNKKYKEDLQQIRQKFSKRQNYLMTVQKALKGEKQRYLQVQRQFTSLKQNYRLVSSQKEIIQQNLKQLTKSRQTKDKQFEELEKRAEKYRKDVTTIKNGFNRLISLILEYMVKRYNERTNFQDISNNSLDLAVDGQIIGYVNVALKKFCQDHNKTRELIKQLEDYKRSSIIQGQNKSSHESRKKNGLGSQNYKNFEGQQNQYYESEVYIEKSKRNNYAYQQNLQQANYALNKRKYLNNNRGVSPSRISSNTPYNLESGFFNDPIKQLQTYRVQIDRLKKQQSQSKVKIKSLQEQIEKHERQYDNEKFEQSRVKNQLEEAQDQITRINFTLRKKEKIIKQLQIEVQDLQKENFQLKSNPSTSPQKSKQKISSPSIISENFSLPIIKDLQSKLNLKSQELIHVQKQVQSLRQQYLIELNQIKKFEQKLKEKSLKIVSLQKQLQNQAIKKFDQKDKQIIRMKKLLQKQSQQREHIQEKVRELQNLMKQYELQIHNLQNRNKQLQEQIKLSQIQIRRNLQSNEYKLNDKATFYQTQILQYKSQLSQQRDKCQQLIQKNSHLNMSLAKKAKEIQTLREKISSKQKELVMLSEDFDEFKNRNTLKINELNDKIREFQLLTQGKSFELQECRFAYEGRVLQLQRQIDQFRQNLLAGISHGNNSAR